MVSVTVTESVRTGEHMTDTITLHEADQDDVQDAAEMGASVASVEYDETVIDRSVREHLEDLLVKVRNLQISVVRTEGADAVVNVTVTVGNTTFTANRKAL